MSISRRSLLVGGLTMGALSGVWFVLPEQTASRRSVMVYKSPT